MEIIGKRANDYCQTDERKEKNGGSKVTQETWRKDEKARVGQEVSMVGGRQKGQRYNTQSL